MKQIYKIIFLLFIATTGLLAQNNDCIDALPICTTSSQNFPSGNSGSGTADPGLNVGCATESQSSWYYFTVTTGGTLTFVIDPVNNSTDYDFALYLSPYGSPANPATDCNGSNELGAPVRCNFSGTTGNTGLSTTATNASEPSSGPTFSSALTVTTGQVYYLMINNYSGDGYPFSFYANTGNTAVLSCTGVTAPTSPCTCTTPTCANAFHATESAATSENGTVTTGADCTLFSPVIPVEQDGSTDMTFCADYTIPVGTTLAAFTTGGQFKYVSGGSCTGSIINRSVYASGSCGAALISTGNVTSGGFPIYAVTPGATYVFCQTIRLAGPDCLQYNSSCINVFSVPAPPANDQCAGAVAITACPSSTAGTTINATTTNDPTVTCNGETVDAPGVWYTYTNVATQSVTLDTDNATTNFDTKIHVYTAAGVCTGPYTCVTADDDAGAGTTSLVSFTAVGGTTYYILVNGVSGATGNFALDINCTTAPVNDACSGALTLACGSTLTGQNNTAATSTEDGLVCGTTVGATSRGMWYKIVGDGRIATLTTTSLTGSEITVWTGSDCSSLTCLSGVLGTTHTFTAEAGTTYYVLASTNAGGASTAFSIGLTCADPAYNVGGGTTGGGTAFCNGNNYLGSTTALPERTMVVTALTGTLRDPGGTGNYANSTDTRGTPTVICPNGGDGGTMTFTFSSFATESGIDLVYVYDGPTYRYPQVAGSPFSGTNLPSSITSTNATGCLTFEFYSDGSVVNTGFQGTWTSSGDTGVDIVPNDDCSNAIPVGIECPTVSGTNINATASCSDPTSSFFAALTLENTVWFKFTATAADAGATIVTLNNIICPDFVNNGLAATSRGLQMGVYNAGTGGSCPPATINDVSATRVASASAVGVTTLSTGSFTTVAGNTYYIGIDGNAASSCEWDITIDRYATNFAVNSATSGSYSYTCDAAPAQTADVALTLSGGRTTGYSVTVVPSSISVTNSGSVYTLNNIPDGTTWTATATDGLCTQIISGTYDYNLTCNPCATYSKNEVDITPVASTVCAGATVAMTTAVDATRSVPTVRAATLGGRKYGDGVGGTAPLNYVADYKKYIHLLPFSTMNATTIGTGVSQAQINGLDFTINAKWNDMYIALKNTSCAGSVVIWNGVNNTAFAGGTDATVSTGSTTLTYSAATGLFTPNTSISSYSSTATLAAMNTAFAGCNPQGFYLEFNDQSSAVLQYSINNFLFSVTDKTTTAITPTTTLTNITWVGSGAATGGTSGSHTNIAELTLSNSDKNATFTAPPCAGPGNCVYTYTVTGKDVNGCTVTGTATIAVTPPDNYVNNITLCAGAAASSFSSTASCGAAISTSVVVNFNITAQPTETNASPGNTVATATIPAFPAGTTFSSAVLSVPNITALGGSWQSDVRLGFGGAYVNAAAAGSAINTNGIFNYTRTITTPTIPLAGGSVNLLYWDNANDNAGAEATFPTGATAATLTINYTYTPVVEWYTVATGGTAVQTGTTFNPINDAEVLAAGAPYSSLNNTNTPGVYTFYTGCTGSTCREPVTYTINAKPVITAGLTQTLCSGTAASRSITLSTDLPGTETFAWNAPTMTAGISGGTAGTGSTITDVLSNSGGTAGTATYTVTVTADAADGGCTNTANVVITVNPNPTITLSSSSTAVCSGTTSATLAYSATTGTPNQYSVDYDATAEGQGFVDVTNSTLPATPITLTVPAGAAPGTYNAAITVRNSTTGCVSTIYNVTVTVNDLPTITLGTSPTICSGTTTANLPYTATTNSPNQYSIDFNAAANTAGLSDVALTTLPASPIAITVPAGIAPGTYTGTITVKNTTTGCSSTATTFTLTVNATPSITSVTTACTGMTYDITVNATTASGTLEYSLDGGAYQPSNIFTALASGSTHSVTVRTVGTTCTATQSGITRDCSCAAPPAVTITEASVEVCGTAVATFNYTVANGPANVTETGAGTLSTTSLANGTGTFTYTPAAGDIGSTIVVTATIPDPDGVGSCVAATDAVDVVVKAIPAITVGTLTNPTTCGGTNGSIALNFTNVPDGTYTVSFTGGSGSASVSVSGGTGTISGLAAGTYSGFQITVNGCTNTATGTATLSDPTTPTITLSSTSTSVCSGTTSATLAYTATTGTPDQYSINYDATAEGQGFVDVNNAALPASPITLTVPAGAAAGTYNATITVRNSTTGCVSSVQNITVVVNSLPTAGITNNTGSTVLGCPPVGVSSVSVTATGGGTYSWSGGATPSTAANTFTTADTYTVTVTVSGCPSTASITITGTTTVPSAPTGTLAITNSTCSGCAVSGGSIAIGTVSGSGGTLEYSTDGGTTWSSSLPSYAPPQTIIASILASNGCRSATTAVGTTVAGVCTTPDAPTGTLAIANSTCSSCAVSGGSIAIGTVSGSGGTLEYSTDGGTTWSSSLPSYAPPQTIIASVLASNGCRSATTAVGTTVAGVCTTPAAPTGTLAITNSTCSSCAVSGGSIAIGTVSGSGGTLEYSTDGGTTWSSTIPTYNQTGPAQTIIASVLAGNGCRSATTAVGTTVPGTCTTPTAPVVGLVTQPTCSTATGSVALSGLPASGTWTITTSPGGTTTTGTGTSTTISGLAANTYTFTVTNATGCTSAASTSATIDPQPATPSITSTPTTCTGSTYTITVNATVSSGTLEYSIDGGAYQTSNSFTGLTNGSTHSITVRTVGTTCTATATGITATCACPAPPAVSITETTLSTCGTTSVTINYSVTNGPATLTTTGTGTFSTTTLNNGTGTVTYTPSAGDAGTTVTLTATIPDPDGGGICASATDAVAVTVNARPNAVAGVGSSIACGGNINLTATPSGATSYSWAGPGGYTANVQNPVRTTATASMAGIYTVTVTGTNGCTASATTNVSVGACSFVFRISDPCSCLNNATTLTNGQFSEVVTVFGPAGFVVRAQSITGLYQTSSTALVTVPFSTPVNMPHNGLSGTQSGYALQGVHVDDIGYTIIAAVYEANGITPVDVDGVTPGVQNTMIVMNKCAYPNPDFALATSICSHPNNSIVLSPTNSYGPDGTGVFSGTGIVGGTTFSSTTAGIGGPYPITLSYTGGIVVATTDLDGDGDVDADDNGVSPDNGTTPAYPGCTQPVVKSISVTNCCAADEGTW